MHRGKSGRGLASGLSIADLQPQLTLQKEGRGGDWEGRLGQTEHMGKDSGY